MKQKTPPATPPLFLGIEAGATKCVAILANATDHCLQRIEGSDPANLRLLSDARLRELLENIAARVPHPAALGIGMAGALNETDRDRIRAAAASVWPHTPCWAGHDLETALAAAAGDPAASPGSARVIVISGTGASCCGQRANGTEVLTGGWGHLLGDRGSGFDIALRAMQAVFRAFDLTGKWPPLGRRLLRTLQLDSPAELIAWVGSAGKPAIAALAVELFAAAAARDPIAREILTEAAAHIADNAIACARRLVRKGRGVEFVLSGSVLQKQPGFARQVGCQLKAQWPGARVQLLAREGAWGAVALARHQHSLPLKRLPQAAAVLDGETAAAPVAAAADWIPRSKGLSPTEQRNPLSQKLDRMSVAAAIRLMLGEDATLPAALLREQRKIARAVQLITHALRGGGRLIYVGAGTSGRLAALDAYECPPTFSVAPDLVQAIVAGGEQAMHGAREDAEDDFDGGAAALQQRGVSSKDIVVGIAASGRTPFVWGALHAARDIGAPTILLCFNPNLVFERGRQPTLVIAPAIGPEVLTGSTRLKAGTATKLLLNIFTTLAMVQLGKVVENLMIDVFPSNAKLRERAIRIVQDLTGAERATAAHALGQAAWSIPQALPLAGGGAVAPAIDSPY